MPETVARFQRKTTPRPMRFQARDGQILHTMYAYDGILARRQIKAMFWEQSSSQAMDHRLSLLFHAGYITIPTLEDRRVHPIPEPVVWLSWRGVLYVASQMGHTLEAPRDPNENQLRILEHTLRQLGVRWLREPRWSQLSHDLAVNDFRAAVERAVTLWPSLRLEMWLPEGEFLSSMDTIRLGGKDGPTKGVRPDGFLILTDHLHLINGSPARARFLLELDNSTHPLSRFGRDKARAGLAYLRSPEFRQRFGYNSGRWLVVCKSEARLKNIKAQTEKVLGSQASHFLFTTMDKVTSLSVLSLPIWQQGGSDKQIALVGNIGVKN